jgi:hypothetical protein
VFFQQKFITLAILKKNKKEGKKMLRDYESIRHTY